MSMAKARLDDRSTRRDRFHQKAKREGFAARAVYKLEEIDDKVDLFSEGDRVLDLMNARRTESELMPMEQLVG